MLIHIDILLDLVLIPEQLSRCALVIRRYHLHYCAVVPWLQHALCTLAVIFLVDFLIDLLRFSILLLCEIEIRLSPEKTFQVCVLLLCSQLLDDIVQALFHFGKFFE